MRGDFMEDTLKSLGRGRKFGHYRATLEKLRLSRQGRQRAIGRRPSGSASERDGAEKSLA